MRYQRNTEKNRPLRSIHGGRFAFRGVYWPAEICKPTDLPLRYSAIAALFLESRADQTVLCAPESSSASMLCCVNQLEGISNRSSPTRSRNSLSAAASKSCGQ